MNMKKIITAGLAAALILTGCTGKTPSTKTQKIADTAVEETSLPTPNPSADLTNIEAQNTVTSSENLPAQTDSLQAGDLSSIVTGDLAVDEENYYKIKAEKEAVEIEIENLEASFRIGELTIEELNSQKTVLTAQENTLEMQEDLLENSLDLAYRKSNPQLPQGSAQELMAQKNHLENQDSELDIAENSLAIKYRSGEISREDFLTQQTELVRQQEALDREEDLIEQALELMGFDD